MALNRPFSPQALDAHRHFRAMAEVRQQYEQPYADRLPRVSQEALLYRMENEWGLRRRSPSMSTLGERLPRFSIEDHSLPPNLRRPSPEEIPTKFTPVNSTNFLESEEETMYEIDYNQAHWVKFGKILEKYRAVKLQEPPPYGGDYSLWKIDLNKIHLSCDSIRDFYGVYFGSYPVERNPAPIRDPYTSEIILSSEDLVRIVNDINKLPELLKEDWTLKEAILSGAFFVKPTVRRGTEKESSLKEMQFSGLHWWKLHCFFESASHYDKFYCTKSNNVHKATELNINYNIKTGLTVFNHDVSHLLAVYNDNDVTLTQADLMLIESDMVTSGVVNWATADFATWARDKLFQPDLYENAGVRLSDFYTEPRFNNTIEVLQILASNANDCYIDVYAKSKEFLKPSRSIIGEGTEGHPLMVATLGKELNSIDARFYQKLDNGVVVYIDSMSFKGTTSEQPVTFYDIHLAGSIGVINSLDIGRLLSRNDSSVLAQHFPIISPQLLDVSKPRDQQFTSLYEKLEYILIEANNAAINFEYSASYGVWKRFTRKPSERYTVNFDRTNHSILIDSPSSDTTILFGFGTDVEVKALTKHGYEGVNFSVSIKEVATFFVNFTDEQIDATFGQYTKDATEHKEKKQTLPECDKHVGSFMVTCLDKTPAERLDSVYAEDLHLVVALQEESQGIERLQDVCLSNYTSMIRACSANQGAEFELTFFGHNDQYFYLKPKDIKSISALYPSGFTKELLSQKELLEVEAFCKGDKKEEKLKHSRDAVLRILEEAKGYSRPVFITTTEGNYHNKEIQGINYNNGKMVVTSDSESLLIDTISMYDIVDLRVFDTEGLISAKLNEIDFALVLPPKTDRVNDNPVVQVTTISQLMPREIVDIIQSYKGTWMIHRKDHDRTLCGRIESVRVGIAPFIYAYLVQEPDLPAIFYLSDLSCLVSDNLAYHIPEKDLKRVHTYMNAIEADSLDQGIEADSWDKPEKKTIDMDKILENFIYDTDTKSDKTNINNKKEKIMNNSADKIVLTAAKSEATKATKDFDFSEILTEMYGGPIGMADQLGVDVKMGINGKVAVQKSGAYYTATRSADGHIELHRFSGKTTMKNPAIIHPELVSGLRVGDLILREDNTVVVVLEGTPTGGIAGVAIQDQQRVEIYPVSSMWNPQARYVRKVSPLMGTEGLMQNPSGLQALLPVLMMQNFLGGGSGKGGFPKEMMMFMMPQMMGQGGGNMMSMLPMMSMMGGEESGLSGLFGGSGEGSGNMMQMLMMSQMMGQGGGMFGGQQPQYYPAPIAPVMYTRDIQGNFIPVTNNQPHQPAPVSQPVHQPAPIGFNPMAGFMGGMFGGQQPVAPQASPLIFGNNTFANATEAPEVITLVAATPQPAEVVKAPARKAKPAVAPIEASTTAVAE